MKNNFTKKAKAWSSLVSGNVFYVPVLGPVFAPKNKDKLLCKILQNSKSKKFLPYDKSKKWFRKKQEKFILELTMQDDKSLVFFTEDNFFRKINVYLYSLSPLDKNVFLKIKNTIKANGDVLKYKNIILKSFQKSKYKKPEKVHNLYLKKFNRQDKLKNIFEDLFFFKNLQNQEKESFAKLGQATDEPGFDFIWHEYLKKSKNPGPIICAVKNKKIVGAIGPLLISEDFAKNNFLPPPFFGVAKKYQRQGLGKKLWQTASDYARDKKAKYTLVQNIPGTAASKFYKKQKLELAQQIFTYEI